MKLKNSIKSSIKDVIDKIADSDAVIEAKTAIAIALILGLPTIVPLGAYKTFAPSKEYNIHVNKVETKYIGGSGNPYYINSFSGDTNASFMTWDRRFSEGKNYTIKIRNCKLFGDPGAIDIVKEISTQ
jgi:hypothetical protein